MSEPANDEAVRLESHHRETFSKLRIPEPLLASAQIHSVSHCEATQLVGDFHKFDLTGVAFPYCRPGETRPHSHRVRRDNVRGEDPKYIAPPGHRALYFPPMSDALLYDVTVPVIFPESEKAALAFTALAERIQRRWLAAALGGCWGWCAKTGIETAADGSHFPTTGPHPDFDRMALRDRDAIIVFDSNATSNPKVRKAEREFARLLQERGAKVRIARIPQSQGVNGPDDYLSAFGDEAMVRIIDSALAHGAPRDPVERLANLECFAQIQPKPMRWVWRDRIPAGKLSLIVGDPDKGKSLITIDIAARITAGKPFPDGAPTYSHLLESQCDPDDSDLRRHVHGIEGCIKHFDAAVRVQPKRRRTDVLGSIHGQ